MTRTKNTLGAISMALLLTLAALLICAPAQAGLLSFLPGAQESSKLANGYAVLREDFIPHLSTGAQTGTMAR